MLVVTLCRYHIKPQLCFDCERGFACFPSHCLPNPGLEETHSLVLGMCSRAAAQQRGARLADSRWTPQRWGPGQDTLDFIQGNIKGPVSMAVKFVSTTNSNFVEAVPFFQRRKLQFLWVCIHGCVNTIMKHHRGIWEGINQKKYCWQSAFVICSVTPQRN